MRLYDIVIKSREGGRRWVVALGPTPRELPGSYRSAREAEQSGLLEWSRRVAEWGLEPRLPLVYIDSQGPRPADITVLDEEPPPPTECLSSRDKRLIRRIQQGRSILPRDRVRANRLVALGLIRPDQVRFAPYRSAIR